MVYITNQKKDVKMLKKIAVKPISSVLNILTSLLWSIRVVAKKKRACYARLIVDLLPGEW